MRHHVLLCLVLAAGALAAAPASTPSAAATSSCNGNRPSALKGHNSNAPIDWSGEHTEIDDKTSKAVLTGNVVATQGELTLNAARVIATYSRNPSVHIDRLDASGGVVIHSPSETARGAFAIYDLDRRIITMIGNVTLTRCDGNVNGGRLVYDLDSGRVVMEGSGGRTGRVSGTFTVPEKTSKPAAGASPAPSH